MMAHKPGARIMFQAASIGTLGLYRHKEGLTQRKMQEIAEQRREAMLKRTPQLIPDAQHPGGSD
jgi:hypothetical protein